MGYLIDRTHEFCVARACDCKAHCSLCGDRGYLYETVSGYEMARECQCRIRPRRLQLFNAARIPARCNGTFEDFKPRAQQKLVLAKETAWATVHEYKREHPSRGFVISGPVGTGKTHLLCATLHWLTLEAGFSARYVESSFLYSEIKNGFSHGQSVLDALQPLIAPDVLAIDELGRGRCTEFELETIDELIARRYNSGRTTIFATNYLLTKRPSATGSGYYDPAQTQASRCLVDRIGDRCWSRLNEMCHLIELPQETTDYRLNRTRR
jgi:DNA replication protein DnaC